MSKEKHCWQYLTICISLVLNSFIMKHRFITKSIDCKSDFVSGQASKPYKITGMHLLIIRCKKTSSEANIDAHTIKWHDASSYQYSYILVTNYGTIRPLFVDEILKIAIILYKTHFIATQDYRVSATSWRIDNKCRQLQGITVATIDKLSSQ